MESVKEKLPQELTETLTSREFDDEAGLLIESLKYIDTDLYLTFSVRFFDKGTSPHIWQVIVSNFEEEHITREWTQRIDIYNEHILLLEYHDVQTELYFRGSTSNDQQLFIDLYKSINRLSDEFGHISKYILPPEMVKTLCSQEYGLFARGPKTILDLYANELTKQMIKPNFIGEYQPTVKDKSMKLLMIGESYFIGSDFVFEREQ